MRTRLFSLFNLAFAVLALAASPLAGAAPRIEHWQTPTGARVFFVENHDLPIVDVAVDFAAGSAYDPAGKAGLAALTHGLLDAGAGKLSESEISDRLADLGAQLSGSVDKDRAGLRLRTLAAKDKQGPALAILRDVLAEPRFAQDVLDREKARSILALKEALTQPDPIASRAFWKALYPQHAYGREATPESIESLGREDLVGFYQRNYGAPRAVVTLVGDLTRAEAEAVAQKLTADLPTGTGDAAPGAPQLPTAGEEQIAHPAAQAHVLIGLPALKRGDPDFFALVVGNYTLGGGGFVSRLMHEVREKRGYAYSVYSYFMPMAEAGPFQIGLQTKKEQAADALRVTREVLARFLAEGPSAAELKAAKQNLVGSFPLRIDSNRKILDNVAVIGFYGLPLDYLDTYTAKVEKVSAAEVRAAFARHVKPENLVTVVVGGAEAAAK